MKRVLLTVLAALMIVTMIPTVMVSQADSVSYTTQAQLSELAESSSLAEMEIDIAYTGSDINLAWGAAEGATGYDIYRSTGLYSEFTKIASTEDTTYTDTAAYGSRYAYYYYVAAVDTELTTEKISLERKLFGTNMHIFSESDNRSDINNLTSSSSDTFNALRDDEFSNQRVAFAFKPGDYSDLKTVFVGYYTSVYGLGETPMDTTIYAVEVPSASNGNSLINFWRSMENIALFNTGENKWAASQAAPIRRVYSEGHLHYDDIGKESSGGFLADSIVSYAGAWSQQQFFVRNTDFTGVSDSGKGWYDGLWNIVFTGSTNVPDDDGDQWNEGTNPDEAIVDNYTTIETTEVMREKPFLYLGGDGNYYVFVGALREDSIGASWSKNNIGEGRSIPIEQFYVAKEGVDDADSMNKALEEGYNLLITPGIYELDESLKVTNPDTVVLGMGMATLRAMEGNAAIEVADVDGVSVAGLLLDAGPVHSDALLIVGDEDSSADHSKNPTVLSDVFCRVGGWGEDITDVQSCVVINSDDVICDHLWLWRADHGDGVGWDMNLCANGLVVYGDDVSCYGLFVEHFQEYQTLWYGKNGATFFYQSEIPYDPPYQEDYMNGEELGFASYKVMEGATGHRAYGLGIYEVFVYTLGNVHLGNAMEVPEDTWVYHIVILSLGHNGAIDNIINGTGTGVDSANNGFSREWLISYGTEPTEKPTDPEILWGEVSGDGKVNAVDATQILLSVVGKKTLTEEQLMVADVNGDGKVNAADATRILLSIVGTITLG